MVSFDRIGQMLQAAVGEKEGSTWNGGMTPGLKRDEELRENNGRMLLGLYTV